MLEEKCIEIEEVVDARKIKIDENAAWEMFKQVEKVVVGAGKTCYEFKPDTEKKSDLLKRAMGRSGSLRAPALWVGKIMLIGFNDAMGDTFL